MRPDLFDTMLFSIYLAVNHPTVFAEHLLCAKKSVTMWNWTHRVQYIVNHVRYFILMLSVSHVWEREGIYGDFLSFPQNY